MTLLEQIELTKRLFNSIDVSPEMIAEVESWGRWLGGKLTDAGATDFESRCSAFGQRAWGQRREDLPRIAQECLDRFHKGEPDIPGEALARKLFFEWLAKARQEGGAQ